MILPDSLHMMLGGTSSLRRFTRALLRILFTAATLLCNSSS
eukprot:CAMPEP_0172080594 /NCGR_PEP_ID=MMETSP1043-20130122/18826_1 /TAXON_ID=464988 /ORGANISM="Hemiselmis andersenii, Strain CCMP441" /LENGTH=40 /DNA_ID= /DNA_START= /DNA_END= /DNA_ORIENTATION=